MNPAGPEDTRYTAVLALLRTADTLWNASHSLFARWALSPSQFNVLNLLSDQSTGLTQTELGRALIMHRSNVTGLVDRLERRGLIVRREVPGDRRVKRVELTEAGRRLWQEIYPHYRDAAVRIWGRLPARRAHELTGVLETLAAQAEVLSQQIVAAP